MIYYKLLFYMAEGEGLLGPPMVLTPSGRCRSPVPHRSRRCGRTWALFSPLSLDNKKGPDTGAFFIVWLGDKDSNLGWRSQSPQSCR